MVCCGGVPVVAERATKAKVYRRRRQRRRRGYTAIGMRHTGETSSEDSGGNTSSSSEWDPTAEDQTVGEAWGACPRDQAVELWQRLCNSLTLLHARVFVA